MKGLPWLLVAQPLLACSSAADPSISSPLQGPPPSDCGLQVMAQSCAVNGCHLASPGNPPQANLELTVSALGDGHSLVNAPAQGNYCSMFSNPPPVIIDPKVPENSLLYAKVIVPPKCGEQMPLARPVLPAPSQQCILEWIKGVPGVGIGK